MKRVLIIDDDPVFAKIYQSLFGAEGYLVDVAPDYGSAIEQLREQTPDLVLLDLFLGRKNGVEILKFIRTRSATRSLPVIALSNSTLSRRIDAAWRAGADRFLAKEDIEPEHMLRLAHSILSAPPPADDEANDCRELQPNGAFRPAPSADLMPGLTPRMAEYRLLQEELRRWFRMEAELRVRELRTQTDAAARSAGGEEQRQRLAGCWQLAAALGREARLLGLDRLAQVARLTATVLQDLGEDPQELRAPSIQAVGLGIDCLARLIEKGAGRSAEQSRPPFCLLVEDDPMARWAMSSALEHAGMNWVGADDSVMAMKLAQENQFDVVLLDWQLPGANGVELCGQIRAVPANSNSAVIFVTARVDFESRVRSSLTGADDFVPKPFLVSELALRSLTCVVRNQLCEREPICKQ